MTKRKPGTEFHLYLGEINRTPLLAAEEEGELGRRISNGDAGARDRLIRANLRLVVNLARSYLGRGLPLDDLISEGNLGLIRAVEGFDETRGVRFSTYAAYWIKQAMRDAVREQGKTFRLPGYVITLLSKWRRATAVLAERLGRAPTAAEVGNSLRLSDKQMSIVAHAMKISTLTPIDDEEGDGSGLARLLLDENGKSVAEVMEDAEETERLKRHLDELPKREAMVLRMRFGLDPYVPMTLRQVGELLGLTHEAVRKMEKRALRRLTEAPA